jgi:hypothetical protein
MELALTYMGLRQYDKANEYFDLSFERGGTNFWIKAANYWLVGQLDSARAMVVEEDRQLGPPEVGGRNGSPITWFWQEYFQREFEDAIHRLEAWDHQLVQDAGYHGPKRLYIGFAYQALGQVEGGSKPRVRNTTLRGSCWKPGSTYRKNETPLAPTPTSESCTRFSAARKRPSRPASEPWKCT